jgi:Ca2+-binding EF-hand superfamily protein
MKFTRSVIPMLAVGACLMPCTSLAKGRPPHPPHPPLCAPLKSYDTDNDGTVSADELAAAKAAEVAEVLEKFLGKLDLDDDGTVTTAEATSVFGFISADWLEHVLERFDKNDDGAITGDDYKNKGPRGLRELVADLDSDADGELSADELQDAADAQAAERLAKFLEKFDTDTDGNVTTDEVIAAIQAQADKKFAALLERFDANDDGAITRAEVAAVLGKKRKN